MTLKHCNSAGCIYYVLVSSFAFQQAIYTPFSVISMSFYVQAIVKLAN